MAGGAGGRDAARVARRAGKARGGRLGRDGRLVLVRVLGHVDPGSRGHGLPGVAEDLGRHQVGAAQGRDAEVRVRLGPDGVVDLGHGLAGAERLDAQLRGHDVAVVALGQGEEQVGVLGAGAAQHVLVGAVAAQGGAREARGQPVERGRFQVDDQDLPAGPVQLVGDAGADAPAADHDGFHACSSGIASRTTQVAHGAFFRT